MRPARNTLHQEIVCLRQVLKCANRHGWLAYLPDLSAPFRASGKVSHRGWFSLAEYKQACGDAEAGEEPAQAALAQVVRAVPRLCAVHGQHRAAA